MNSQVFNIKRFGLLFLTELKAGIKKNWISLLIISLIGLIVASMVALLTILLGDNWTFGGTPVRMIYYIIFFACLVIQVPNKLYGHVNDASSGPAYLMLPASRLEKYLSMILISIVVVPLAVIAIFLGIDALLCLIDPRSGGFVNPFGFLSGAFITGLSPEGISLSPYMFIDDLAGTMLVFLLGTVFFRRHKTAKTILSILIISQLLSFVSLGALALIDLTDLPASEIIGFVMNHLLLFDTVSDSLSNLLLLAGIWFTLKTLKQ